MKQRKIVIIGAGSVGSTTAYGLCLRQIAAEIVLVDADEKRCTGELLDLSDIQALIPSGKISKGNYTDAYDADIVIIAAGKRQCPGETRDVLYETNKPIIQSICQKLQPIHRDAIIIMVTNPVDPLTFVAQQCLPLDQNKIFGSGTLLDSLRLRKFIGQHVSVSPQSVNAFVFGQHGDSHVIQWSCISIGTTPLEHNTSFSDTVRNDIAQKTKNEVYEIINCKGATFFGVATCVMHLCEAILFDTQLILPVSCRLNEEDICISLPVTLGRNGIIDYAPLYLSPTKQEQMDKSIHYIKQYR